MKFKGEVSPQTTTKQTPARLNYLRGTAKRFCLPTAPVSDVSAYQFPAADTNSLLAMQGAGSGR